MFIYYVYGAYTVALAYMCVHDAQAMYYGALLLLLEGLPAASCGPTTTPGRVNGCKVTPLKCLLTACSRQPCLEPHLILKDHAEGLIHAYRKALKG